MDLGPGTPAVRAPQQRAVRRARDQRLVVGGIDGQREDGVPPLMRNRFQRGPCRVRRRARDGAQSGDQEQPQRHDGRGKTLAKKRHERADYHPSRLPASP